MIKRTKRIVLTGLGLFFVGLGFVGIVLPVLPTTPFLILALWCFTQSSAKLEAWLLNHRIFGPILRDWQDYGIIPIWGKVMAISMMTLSFSYLAFIRELGSVYLIPTALLMLVGGGYILSRPSRRAASSRSSDGS